MWSLEDRIFFENALGHGPVRKGSRVHERLRVFDFEFFACANLALYAFTSLSFNSIRVGGRRNMVQVFTAQKGNTCQVPRVEFSAMSAAIKQDTDPSSR